MSSSLRSGCVNWARFSGVLSSMAVVALLLFAPSCMCGTEDGVASPELGYECDDQGDRVDGLVCDDGIWVESDAGYGVGGGDAAGDDDVDASPIDDTGEPQDVSCDAESHREFCERNGVECGSFVGLDNCDNQRIVHCGAFSEFQCQSPEICAHASDDDELDANQCVCPTLDEDEPEKDICGYADAECGTVNVQEVCGGWEEFGDIDCDECSEAGVECGSDLPNVCGCPCEIDGQCYAEGEEDPDNVCFICDPEQGDDEFSPAPDGTDCGDGGICDDSECVCEADADECDGECVDFDTNRDHCGQCENACDDDEFCSDGECQQECSSELTLCDGQCVDQDSDDEHCGDCGEECSTDVAGATAFCSDGECEVVCSEEDHTICDGQCTNTDIDRDHCGDCGEDCAFNETCSAGSCQTVATGCSEDDECGDLAQCCNEECIPDAANCPGG